MSGKKYKYHQQKDGGNLLPKIKNDEDIELGSIAQTSASFEEHVEEKEEYTIAEIRNTHIEYGLTTAEVLARRRYYGRNTVPTPHATQTGLRLFLQQLLGSFLPILCEVFAIVLIVCGKWRDCLVLCTMLLINGTYHVHTRYSLRVGTWTIIQNNAGLTVLLFLSLCSHFLWLL